MFSIKSNLNRRSNRYNIYQPQRYAIYVAGKWMGLVGSALLLFGLTIKWYFLLDDNTPTPANIATWCVIVGSVMMFVIGALFILGLHWYVEKKYNHNVQASSDEMEKTQKHLREEHRNQSKRFKERTVWLRWKTKKNLRISRSEADQQSSINNSIKPNSTTIYNTNKTESSFQVISNDSFASDSNSTVNSFSSTKKLVRTNSKFNQPSLPIIDETKQQSANDSYAANMPSTSGVQAAYDTHTPQQPDGVIFDTSSKQESNKPNKTRHAHKSSTASAKDYILEQFLKSSDHHTEASSKLSDQMMSSKTNNQSQSSQTNLTNNVNGALNDALDYDE